MSRRKVALSWSSGKDSAWVLEQLRAMPDVEVVALITSINGESQRVAMHGVRRALVELQAARLGLPLWIVELPFPCTNADYESGMSAVWRRAVDEGISGIAFGDLFLREIRDYREKQLAGTGLELMFPAWDIPTDELAQRMVKEGYEAVLTCIDTSKLDLSFAGLKFDATMLKKLPQGVDHCGENGEFHTFVTASPGFSSKISVSNGAILSSSVFAFTDIDLGEHQEPSDF